MFFFIKTLDQQNEIYLSRYVNESVMLPNYDLKNDHRKKRQFFVCHFRTHNFFLVSRVLCARRVPSYSQTSERNKTQFSI